MSKSITENLFATLDILVFEYLNEGCFQVVGTVPHWFSHIYLDPCEKGDKLMLEERFPFIENFIIDAEKFWAATAGKSLKSGLWIETDTAGKEFYLEASAVRLDKHKILLISLGEIAIYQEKYSLIQKARENSLNYQYLLKEVQKKEILIHCIIHDLAGQLTGIKYCFELLALQKLTDKGHEYLDIGRKQCIKQELLIRQILDAFSAEVEALETFTVDPAQAPDALICVQEIINALLPTFIVNNIKLQIDPSVDKTLNWKVVGEKSRLERVLNNLVENAFRHSPPNSMVSIGLNEDNKFILFTVDDQGSGVSADITKNLFQKFSQGKEKAGRMGLGLYFCRITVERWGGEIGYSLRPEGGSRFWFRLPRL